MRSSSTGYSGGGSSLVVDVDVVDDGDAAAGRGDAIAVAVAVAVVPVVVAVLLSFRSLPSLPSAALPSRGDAAPATAAAPVGVTVGDRPVVPVVVVVAVGVVAVGDVGFAVSVLMVAVWPLLAMSTNT